GCGGPLPLTHLVLTVRDREEASAALGELNNCHLSDVLSALAGYRFAKVGLAGAAANPKWRRLWQQAADLLPPGTQPVAVAYADWQSCGAPPPGEVIEAARGRAAALLIDTHEKQGRNLLHFANLPMLSDWQALARESGMLSVLAGSLRQAEIAKVATISPDFVAVRGAVCRGDRTGRVDRSFVAEIVALLSNQAAEQDDASTSVR
ncbi:MAG: hypothetical protein KDA41_02270, partial [Planctomycetales bacterium]|nr:hypothetical protein [Planctomycetales bacterium]